MPYSDYTYYAPVNTAEKLNDPNRWQPIPFVNPKGGFVTPGFLTPHWYRVKPFALDRSDQFRAPVPPRVDSEQLRKETDENIALNAGLTPEQKATVEFMRDGPRSTGQSGHWLKFAQLVSKRDHNDLDRDVKLFFAVGNVAMDAFIACWETKRYYDTSRPWTLVRYYYAGKKVVGWAGPGKGVVELPAEEWHPYSPFTFVTPPFPGYVSGHSTVSGACAKTLELFTGSDYFGEVEKRKAGVLTEADVDCVAMQARDGKAAQPVNCDVELKLPTFTATAEMAGISRVMGGYHIQADNIEGLALGRKVAQFEWPRIRAYFDGTAPAAKDPMSRRLLWFLLLIIAALALAVVLIPALVIQPFRPQSPRGLEISFFLKRLAPIFTIVTLIACLALVDQAVARRALEPDRSHPSHDSGDAQRVVRAAEPFRVDVQPAGACAATCSANAATFVADSDLVMAVARNGEAAAYPIRQLAYHHLVQDTVGGVPIVVTY